MNANLKQKADSKPRSKAKAKAKGKASTCVNDGPVDEDIGSPQSVATSSGTGQAGMIRLKNEGLAMGWSPLEQ